MTENDLENLMFQTELQMINISYGFMDDLMVKAVKDVKKRKELAKQLNDEKWLLTIGFTRDEYKEHISKEWVKNGVTNA